MAARIPTSTSVTESAVISAPLSQVWHLIKLPSFSTFWSKLEKSEEVKGASPETDLVKWTFKDGTVLEVKQEEHSVGLVRTVQIEKQAPMVNHRHSTPLDADISNPNRASITTLLTASSPPTRPLHTHQRSPQSVSTA